MDTVEFAKKVGVRKNYIYARVSSASQKDGLENQKTFLRNWTTENGLEISEELYDFGSGLNYSRKNFNRLLELVEKGKVGDIYVTHKDRFVRFGFEWFESFCSRHGTRIVVSEKKDTSPQQELVDDLTHIIQLFSARILVLRKYKSNTERDEDLKLEERM